MSTDGRSPPSSTDSGHASEVHPSDQGPTLDDLSPAQAQYLLEAALQRYWEVDETHVMSSRAVVMAPSLLNSSLVPWVTSSGKQAHYTGVLIGSACTH